MGLCSCSQTIWFALVLITLLFAAVTTSAVAYAWLVFSLMFGIMLMLDFMFSNDKDFMYDPDYKTWKQKTQTEA